MFADKLIEKIIMHKNHTVVGLDPRIEYIPKHILNEAAQCIEEEEPEDKAAELAARSFLRFNKELIDSIYDIVPAVKPQIAFYERYGTAGFKCFIETCKYAKSKGMIVIGDVKRGDIGSTAEAYSDFYLGNSSYSAATDCITINPYLGTDSLKPFIRDCDRNGKGVFILVKTSNKSSIDIQDLVFGGKKIYEHVAALVAELGKENTGKYGYSSVGAVVGATFREDGAKLREIMKNSYFLVPGYGAQGGNAEDTAVCFNKDGLGAVVNSSRGIIAAYKNAPYNAKYGEKEFGLAAREAAIEMRDDINRALMESGKLAW